MRCTVNGKSEIFSKLFKTAALFLSTLMSIRQYKYFNNFYKFIADWYCGHFLVYIFVLWTSQYGEIWELPSTMTLKQVHRCQFMKLPSWVDAEPVRYQTVPAEVVSLGSGGITLLEDRASLLHNILLRNWKKKTHSVLINAKHDYLLNDPFTPFRSDVRCFKAVNLFE